MRFRLPNLFVVVFVCAMCTAWIHYAGKLGLGVVLFFMITAIASETMAWLARSRDRH